MFDTYDRLAEKTWSGIEDDDTQVFRFSHLPAERAEIMPRYLPRFSQVAFLVQMPHMNLQAEVTKMKGSELTAADQAELTMRAEYATAWLKEYADEKFIFALQSELPAMATQLTAEQQAALRLFADKLEATSSYDGQSIHELTHAIKEESGLSPKDFFAAIYVIFLGKESGPKVGWFLSTLEKPFVINRLRSV